MKAFRFPLERVLAWRRTQLALEEAALERLRSDLHAIEMAIADVARRDEGAADAMRRTRSVSGPEVADLAKFCDWARLEGQRLKVRATDCKRQIERKTLSVTEARQKVRLVERLKAQRRDSWDVEFNRELEQLAGESAISGWRRDRHSASRAG
ncbi:MAG TPA: hypothetical protein VNH18_16465 [Bryobacteraceae bacterium]|nr:hypothetical protein [Bryobacteraceae bacterium]